MVGFGRLLQTSGLAILASSGINISQNQLGTIEMGALNFVYKITDRLYKKTEEKKNSFKMLLDCEKMTA